MKKTLLICIAAIICFSFTADEGLYKWNDFNSGYSLAKKQKKLMVVDIYTDWCGWCKRMDKDAYAKESVGQVIKKNFVAIKFNPEITGVSYSYNGKSYSGEQLAGVITNNTIQGYPTTVFINPKTHKNEVVSGYKNEEQLKAVLEEMLVKLK